MAQIYPTPPTAVSSLSPTREVHFTVVSGCLQFIAEGLVVVRYTLGGGGIERSNDSRGTLFIHSSH